MTYIITPHFKYLFKKQRHFQIQILFKRLKLKIHFKIGFREKLFVFKIHLLHRNLLLLKQVRFERNKCYILTKKYRNKNDTLSIFKPSVSIFFKSD